MEDINNEEEIISEQQEIIRSRKTRKPQYSNQCVNCNRLFKTEKSYVEHTSKQLCYTPLNITYCKTCNITLPTRLEYEKHLIKLEHIQNVQSKFTGIIEPIDIDPVPTINSADPYLDNNDINNLTKKSLGSNFTIHFNNNKSQCINIIPIKQETIKEETKIIITTPKQTINNIEPSSRQLKILKFLESLTDTTKCNAKLLEILDNKLHIDDYKNLQTIIKQSPHISNDIKQIYLQTIEKFTMALIKLKSKGIEIYKEKDIAKLVTNLTS